MASDISYKNKIQKCFKLSGFSIRGDLCKEIIKKINPGSIEELNKWIENLIDNIQKQSLEQPVIEEKHVEKALKETMQFCSDDTETIFNVINAFEVPKFKYNADRKKFLKDTELRSLNLFADPVAKTEIFKNRYIVLLQHISRNEMFAHDIGTADKDTQKFKLLTIETLISTTLSRDNVVVLGMLTQIIMGKFHLEDPTGVVEIDLSNTSFHAGLYTENCFVLATGYYEDEIFHISALASPPTEPNKISRIYFGNQNTFGGRSKTCLKTSDNLKNIEMNNPDGMIVFLSEVWLDNILVIQKLKTLFQGYNECPPIAFIFIGNFTSGKCTKQISKQLKDSFKKLSDIILQCPNLVKESAFVFVPGRLDPCVPHIFPRPPLPNYITEEFKTKIPKVYFTTNPCRIQYCTQEIVVLREDLYSKMCRNTIYFPKTGNIEDHFSKTLICQGHLAPFNSNIMPVYWDYDYALSLYPLPDVVVIADQYKTFTSSYQNCQVVSPGSFVKNDFSFKVYIPHSKEIDDSSIPDEDV